MTDVLLARSGAAPFTWGRDDLVHVGKARSGYLDALQTADQGDYLNLIAYVRS